MSKNNTEINTEIINDVSRKITPEHKGEKNYSKSILKLAQRITDRIGHKVTTDDPEYWGLACVLTDEMADVALTMKVRKHYTFEELCKRNKIAPDGREKFQKLLDEMADIGILEFDYGDHYDKNGPIPGAPHIREYWVPLFVPGSGEYTNMKPELMKKHPELAKFFERMTFLPLQKVTAMVPPGGAGIGMHVIPVEKAISMENQTMDIEHISYWLKRYEGHIGASLCSCRHGRKTLGEGVADSYEDWCIGVGDMADYCRETVKAATLLMKRLWKSSSVPRTTASFTRSPISTVKARFSPSVTVMSISVMHCVPLSFSIHQICPAALTPQRLKRKNVLPAAVVWNTARQVP